MSSKFFLIYLFVCVAHALQLLPSVYLDLEDEQYISFPIGNPGNTVMFKVDYTMKDIYLFEMPLEYSNTYVEHGTTGSELFYINEQKMRLPLIYGVPEGWTLDSAREKSYKGILGLSKDSIFFKYWTNATFSNIRLTFGHYEDKLCWDNYLYPPILPLYGAEVYVDNKAYSIEFAKSQFKTLYPPELYRKENITIEFRGDCKKDYKMLGIFNKKCLDKWEWELNKRDFIYEHSEDISESTLWKHSDSHKIIIGWHILRRMVIFEDHMYKKIIIQPNFRHFDSNPFLVINLLIISLLLQIWIAIIIVNEPKTERNHFFLFLVQIYTYIFCIYIFFLNVLNVKSWHSFNFLFNSNLLLYVTIGIIIIILSIIGIILTILRRKKKIHSFQRYTFEISSLLTFWLLLTEMHNSITIYFHEIIAISILSVSIGILLLEAYFHKKKYYGIVFFITFLLITIFLCMFCLNPMIHVVWFNHPNTVALIIFFILAGTFVPAFSIFFYKELKRITFDNEKKE